MSVDLEQQVREWWEATSVDLPALDAEDLKSGRVSVVDGSVALAVPRRRGWLVAVSTAAVVLTVGLMSLLVQQLVRGEAPVATEPPTPTVPPPTIPTPSTVPETAPTNASTLPAAIAPGNEEPSPTAVPSGLSDAVVGDDDIAVAIFLKLAGVSDEVEPDNVDPYQLGLSVAYGATAGVKSFGDTYTVSIFLFQDDAAAGAYFAEWRDVVDGVVEAFDLSDLGDEAGGQVSQVSARGAPADWTSVEVAVRFGRVVAHVNSYPAGADLKESMVQAAVAAESAVTSVMAAEIVPALTPSEPLTGYQISFQVGDGPIGADIVVDGSDFACSWFKIDESIADGAKMGWRGTTCG